MTGTLAIPVSAESVPGVYDLSAGEYPQGYAVGVEDAVEDIQHTLAEIQKQQNHIAGSDPLLEDLAIQLFALGDAVKQEDSVTEEVEELLQDVENLLADVDSDIAETALSKSPKKEVR